MVLGRVTAVRREGTRAARVHLAIDAAWHAAHQRPGQYVLVGAAGLPFAIASPPGAPAELLLGDEALARVAPRVDSLLELSAPSGPGFALEAAGGAEVLVFAIGTAASAARALLEAIVAERSRYVRVRAFLGAHTPQAHVYLDHDARWRGAGIELVRAHSRPWVQDLFLASDPPSPGARVFAAGHDAAIAGIRAAMRARQLDPSLLGLNV